MFPLHNFVCRYFVYVIHKYGGAHREKYSNHEDTRVDRFFTNLTVPGSRNRPPGAP